MSRLAHSKTILGAVSCLALGALALQARSTAGAPLPERPTRQRTEALPASVTTWLARDQVQRWTRHLEEGETLFSEGTCVRCHGEGASGGRWAPDLTDTEWVQGDGSLESIGEVIMWGVRRRDLADPSRPFEMNPSGGMDLDTGQTTALTAYIWSRSNGTFLPAGRGATPAPTESLPAAVGAWLARDQVRRWAALIEQGRTLFSEGTCHFCHAEGGVGSRSAPDLTDAEWVQGDGSLEAIYEVIFWGVRRRDFADPTRRNQMNPAGGMDLDYEQLNALTAYVWSLNNGTFLPQR